MAAIVMFSECMPPNVLTNTAIWNVVTQQHSFSFITNRTWMSVAPLNSQCLNMQIESMQFNTACCVMESSSGGAANLSKIIQPQTQLCISTLSTLTPVYRGKRRGKVTAEGASGQRLLMHLYSLAHTRYQIQQWKWIQSQCWNKGISTSVRLHTIINNGSVFMHGRTHIHKHRQTDRGKWRWGLWG